MPHPQRAHTAKSTAPRSNYEHASGGRRRCTRSDGANVIIRARATARKNRTATALRNLSLIVSVHYGSLVSTDLLKRFRLQFSAPMHHLSSAHCCTLTHYKTASLLSLSYSFINTLYTLYTTHYTYTYSLHIKLSTLSHFYSRTLNIALCTWSQST